MTSRRLSCRTLQDIQSGVLRMYDDVAKLINYETGGYDAYGNRKTIKETSDVYVQPRGVYSSEFYNASQLGFKPSITFVIANRADYHEEPIIEFHGVEYKVIRVDWNAQRDSISLVCERRIHGDVNGTDVEDSE